MLDEKKIKNAVIMLLEGMGEDINRPGLCDTPDRIVKMYKEIFEGMEQSPLECLQKTFPASSNSMVIEKDITFYSMCEHHILPFFGKAHIGYIPNGKIVGISKLARTVEIFARRLQLQENMTSQIAEAIMEYLKPDGVIVFTEAEHLCMTMRGAKKPGSKTVTLVKKGVFDNDPVLCDEFLKMI